MQVVPRETAEGPGPNNSHRFFFMLRNNGLTVTDEQCGKLMRYRDLLLEWNKQVNLISRSTSEAEVQFTHFIHSLSPFFFFSLIGDLRIMDLGSGGGLPGIPLAILRPEFRVVLVDSIAKKTRAMESMVNELALQNVQVVNSRAEDLLRTRSVTEKFDIVLARAIGPLSDLVRCCRPLVRQGGTVGEWKQAGQTTTIRLPALMAWKGGELSDELATLKHKTGLHASVFPLVFPGSDEVGLEEKKMVTVEIPPAGGRT
jgi:16S rRNA (guanine527-N7)-methyltransferase